MSTEPLPTLEPVAARRLGLPRWRPHHLGGVDLIVPVAGLSMWDPVFLGVDEHGVPVTVRLIYRNLLGGSDPGGGKSVLLNNVVAHAALSTDVQLWLFDGKQVELGLWADIAEVFVGNDVHDAVDQLGALQAEMDRRYAALTAQRHRKIAQADGYDALLCVVDEIAYFS